MDVSIAQPALRDFASAVACLGKVGAELSLVGGDGALQLRALNGSKSSFAALTFTAFEAFACEGFSCTVLSRPVASALRSLRRVDRLRVYVEESGVESLLVLQLIGAHGVVRCHRLQIGDGEVVHAMFDKDGSSRVGGAPVTFSGLFEHIHGTDELIATVSTDSLKLKSYHSSVAGARIGGLLGKALQTEMQIGAQEFDAFQVDLKPDEDGSFALVFCFREVKALMSFCDAVEADQLDMYFHEGGRPLLFSASKPGVDIELVMSTMEPRDAEATATAPAPRAGGEQERP